MNEDHKGELEQWLEMHLQGKEQTVEFEAIIDSKDIAKFTGGGKFHWLGTDAWLEDEDEDEDEDDCLSMQVPRDHITDMLVESVVDKAQIPMLLIRQDELLDMRLGASTISEITSIDEQLSLVRDELDKKGYYL